MKPRVSFENLYFFEILEMFFFFFLLFVQLDIRFRNYGWKKEFLFRIMDCTSFGGGKFWRILEEIMIQDWSQFFVEINNFFF